MNDFQMLSNYLKNSFQILIDRNTNVVWSFLFHSLILYQGSWFEIGKIKEKGLILDH